MNNDSGRVGVVGIKTISWKVLSWWYRVAFSELHPKRKIGRESPEKLPRKSSDLFVIQLSLLKSKKTTSWGGLMVFLLILRYSLSITLSNTPCLACLHPFSCQDVLRDTLFSFLQVIIKPVKSSRCHSMSERILPSFRMGIFYSNPRQGWFPWLYNKKSTANEDSHLFQISLPDAITSWHPTEMDRSMVPVVRFQQASTVVCCDAFWDQLDEPKVSETENFLGEIPVWGCFDVENCDVSTFERGSLLRTPPCLWNVFFQNNQKPMKTTGGDFPQADAVSQLQKVTWRKSTG